MAALAMGLSCIAAHFCIAATNVDGMRNGFEVVWINAPRILATMVNLSAFRDLSAIQPIRNSVGLLWPHAIPQLSISGRLVRTKPDPASGHWLGHAFFMETLE